MALSSSESAKLNRVIERLEAWAETADNLLRRAKPADESRFRNQRDNYRALIDDLRDVKASQGIRMPARRLRARRM